METSLRNHEGPWNPKAKATAERPPEQGEAGGFNPISSTWTPKGSWISTHLRVIFPLAAALASFPISRQAPLHAQQLDPVWRHHGVPSLLRPVASLRKSCPLDQTLRHAWNPALLKVLSSRLLSPAHFVHRSLDFLHRNWEETWGRV